MLLALHKPYGFLSQFTSEGQWRGLSDLDLPKGVYACGRLDADSEGLLLLTDDGALQHRLSHPKFEHEKTYWAQVEGSPVEADLEPLRLGVQIQDYRTKPCRTRVLTLASPFPPRDPPVRFRKSVPDTWIELRLREGKNRQVRRMTAAVGFPTLRLVRVAIGRCQLDGLRPGTWRELNPWEQVL